MLDKFTTRLHDGFLAGASCFIAASAPAQEAVQQATQEVASGDPANPVVTQVIIPIITGIVAPLLKELAIEWRDKIRARRQRRKALKQAVSKQ